MSAVFEARTLSKVQWNPDHKSISRLSSGVIKTRNCRHQCAEIVGKMVSGLFCYWEGGMCVISWHSKWAGDLNAKPRKPFLPQRLNPPELLSVIGRFCHFSMQQDRFVCFQCNLWYLAGAQCPLCSPLCGDEWIFLPNFIQRCTVCNHSNTFEMI